MRKPTYARCWYPFDAGFTLIELLTTVAVAAVLLAVAAPSFVEIAKRNRLSGYTNDLITAIYYARSEAVRTGAPIAICKSSDGTSCSGSWSDGWIIFRNDDDDDPAVVDSGEPLLKRYQGLAGGYALGSDTNLATSITFGSDGAANRTGVFAFCRGDDTSGARALIVTRLRPRVARDTNGDGIPNLDSGDNITSCDAPSADPEEEE